MSGRVEEAADSEVKPAEVKDAELKAVEAKDAGTEAPKDATAETAKRPAKAAPRAPSKPVVEAKPVAPEPVPSTVTAVKVETPAAIAAKPARKAAFRLDAGTMAAATLALVVGAGFGMLASPHERSGETLTHIDAALESARAENGRLNAEIERLAQALGTIRESNDLAQAETRTLSGGLADRLARIEQKLDKAAVEKREHVASADPEAPIPPAAIPAPIEKRPAPVASTATAAPPAPTPAPTPAAKTDPSQTASIDTKPKTETVENWALRDVYDGIAILEDRKRRLIEVAPGETIPGIGRVESIERRGRSWAVVTKQGLITPQSW